IAAITTMPPSIARDRFASIQNLRQGDRDARTVWNELRPPPGVRRLIGSARSPVVMRLLAGPRRARAGRRAGRGRARARPALCGPGGCRRLADERARHGVQDPEEAPDG